MIVIRQSLLLVLCITGTFLAASAEAATPCKVLFIIADDCSANFGNTYGGKWIKTPNIDKLAAEGLVFDNVYTPTAKCAPSRAAILTGRYPWPSLKRSHNRAWSAAVPEKHGGRAWR